MHVVVTGAGGKLGRAVTASLNELGHAVRGIDRAGDQGAPHCDLIDLTDLGQVYGALAGADAVIHLGAIASPVHRPPEQVFANNVLAQFNVFEAAATLGIRRVVSASSVSALGFPWQHRWSEPRYIPVDESHPLLAQDAYGLSKVVGEEIAAAYCRRGAGNAASLRFSTIMSTEQYPRFIEHVRQDVGAQAHMLWSYVDLRDAAHACILALDAPFEGHAPLFITAADTTSDLPTEVLLERYFPNVPRRAQSGDVAALADRWSLLDGSQARVVLGYLPEYRWPEIISAPFPHTGKTAE